MSNRVVVTGLGVITPLGLKPGDLWENLMARRSGIGPITKFDASDHAVRIAAEVRDFDVGQYLDRREARRMDPYCHYAMAAAREAVDDAALDVGRLHPERVGVILGTGQGGISSLCDQMETYYEKGPRRVSPFLIPMMITNMAAGYVGIDLKARGPNMTLTTACAASAHAIGEAFRILQRGDADVILTGGAEAGIVPISLAGFASMKALSTRNDDPEAACRPFDADRDGFVVGEGAVSLVLETLQHAEARGAEVLGELLGYAATNDAYHVTAPLPSGEGGARSMSLAIRDAGLTPDDIDYINAHGTGTPSGDVAESKAVETVFGERAKQVPVSSTKSMTGHLLGAAGALESVICLLSMKAGMIPPTINLARPGEDCNLDYVVDGPRPARVDVALTNSFGFGGQNASLVWGRVK
ncbi:MAG: beta-ketoacyl-ACP synthase II [Bacillota bacterium]